MKVGERQEQQQVDNTIAWRASSVSTTSASDKINQRVHVATYQILSQKVQVAIYQVLWHTDSILMPK